MKFNKKIYSLYLISSKLIIPLEQNIVSRFTLLENQTTSGSPSMTSEIVGALFLDIQMI